jgi:hypothetical protein
LPSARAASRQGDQLPVEQSGVPTTSVRVTPPGMTWPPLLLPARRTWPRVLLEAVGVDRQGMRDPDHTTPSVVVGASHARTNACPSAARVPGTGTRAAEGACRHEIAHAGNRGRTWASERRPGVAAPAWRRPGATTPADALPMRCIRDLRPGAPIAHTSAGPFNRRIVLCGPVPVSRNALVNRYYGSSNQRPPEQDGSAGAQIVRVAQRESVGPHTVGAERHGTSEVGNRDEPHCRLPPRPTEEDEG